MMSGLADLWGGQQGSAVANNGDPSGIERYRLLSAGGQRDSLGTHTERKRKSRWPNGCCVVAARPAGVGHEWPVELVFQSRRSFTAIIAS
jgi:hypothetical protein